MAELTKVTSKGQVVIPQQIREELKLKEGSKMLVSRIGDIVILKRISLPDPKEEFKRLTKWGEEFAKKKGIKSEEDVVRIIHKRRG